jgi:hypothetical protein
VARVQEQLAAQWPTNVQAVPIVKQWRQAEKIPVFERMEH